MVPRPLILIQSSVFALQSSRRRRALTLVELLIVITIIAVLVGAVLVGGSGLIHRSRNNNTSAVLQLVSEAVEQFKREQTAKPTISGVTQAKTGTGGFSSKDKVAYLDRYDRYPPDELEVFTVKGLPGAALGTARSLAPGNALIHAPSEPATWQGLRYYKDGTAADALENRDQLAMIVAIETLSETASSILDRIPDKNRGNGPADAQGRPALFLDRPGGETGAFDQGDLEIRPILDDWGNPISYMAQRDFGLADYTAIESSNRAGWNEASTEFIRLNGGAPVIFSYGADGKDQLTSTAMTPEAKASLVGDFEEEDPPASHHRIDNPLNDDNVYANPQLREKMAKGLLTP